MHSNFFRCQIKIAECYVATTLSMIKGCCSSPSLSTLSHKRSCGSWSHKQVTPTKNNVIFSHAKKLQNFRKIGARRVSNYIKKTDLLLEHPPPQSAMFLPLHPPKHGKSRRARTDLPAGRALTSIHSRVSASLVRGPCQTTHLAHRQLHRNRSKRTLLPSSSIWHQSGHHLLSFFNQGRSLQPIHHRRRHPAVAADTRTVVEQRRHDLTSISTKIRKEQHQAF